MKKAVLLSIGVGLLVAGLSMFIQTSRITAQTYIQEPVIQETVSTSTAPQGIGTSFAQPAAAARLVIPAIGVDANIQSVGLSWRGDGTMGIPTNFTDVAWYNQGPKPGMPGIAVISGHVDGKDVQKAVFYDLEKLKLGDLVEVIDKKGTVLQFSVVESRTYNYDSPTADIFIGDSAKARINLITCSGDWNKEKKLYNQRIVVTAELVAEVN